ncbi:MAG: sialidase family protein [Pirellulales bacterium]
MCRSTIVVPPALVLALWAGVARSTEPVRAVDEAIVRDARQPQAAIDRDGGIHVVFGSGDSIYHAASDDAKAFGPPVKVASEGKLSLGMRRGPRIAIARGAIVISAIVGARGGGRDGDLLAWRSTDGGKSWSSSTRVNGVAGSAREGLHAMAAGEQGRVYSVWLDLRGGRTEIFGSGSEDGGASWSQNKRIYRSPSGSVCECCHPSVAFGPHGTLYVMWRNSIDGLRDMFLVKSPDGGATFGQTGGHGQGRIWAKVVPPRL